MFILYLDFTRRIRKNFTPWYLLYFRNKKMPEQFEGPGEKRECPGDMKVLGKRVQINSKAPGEKRGWPGEVKVPKKQSIRRAMKKRVPEGGGWSPAQALCFVK